jgi:Lar family restriction alleviation protein
MFELKKCPFCGSDNVVFVPDDEQPLNTTTTGFIWCHGCDFTSDSFFGEEIAAGKWNRRAALEGMKNG